MSLNLERKFERKNIRNIRRASLATERAYKKAIWKISVEISKHKFKGSKPFSLKYNKSFGNKLNTVMGELNHDLTSNIQGFMKEGWGIANQKNDILAAQYLRNVKRATGQHPSFFNSNIGAMNSFINRSVNGLNLSGNIWKLGAESMDLLETYMGTGIAAGRSAANLSRDVRDLLKDPDKLFRRVRDKKGKLVLSKAAKAYHPGRGKYRSSYKNAMRMTRTETNMAYRAADHLRYQQMDFVVGIQVHLSGQHPKYDICDNMAGKYPKTFKFIGWHPHCYCYQTSILANKNDFLNSLKGQPLSTKPIQNIPIRAQRYIKDNLAKLKKAPQKPYWVKDNQAFFDNAVASNVKPTIEIQADALMRRAAEVGDEVHALSVEYAERFGGTSTPINYKKQDSIIRKATDELGGAVHKIKDAARTTIVVEADQMESVIAAMKKDPRFTTGKARIKVQTPDKFMGYSGTLTNIETSNGLICEIQVNSPEMIFAKESPKNAKFIIGEKRWNEIRKAVGVEGGLGHGFYEEFRVLNKAIASEAAEMKRIKEVSEKYYSTVRAKAPKPKIVPETGFKPSKTLREAEDWAKKQGIQVVVESNSFNPISREELLETYNALKEAAFFYEDKLGIKVGSEINFGRKWDVPFGKKIKIIKDGTVKGPFAEYLRTEAAYAEGDSIFINLAKKDELNFAENVKDIAKRKAEISRGAKMPWVPSYNITSQTEAFIHELGHNFYFGYDIEKVKLFKEYFKREALYYNAVSMFGQENASEYFAEAMVSFMRGDKEKAVKIIKDFFSIDKQKALTRKAKLPKKQTYSAIMKDVDIAEEAIRMNKFETAIGWNEYGEETIRIVGEKYSVDFTGQTHLVKDAISTHNHPRGFEYAKNTFGYNGSSFSLNDILLAARHNAKEQRAVTGTYKFIMKRPEKYGWPTTETIKQAYMKADEKVTNLLSPLVHKEGSFFYWGSSGKEVGNANTLHHHLIWKMVAKELGLPYSWKKI